MLFLLALWLFFPGHTFANIISTSNESSLLGSTNNLVNDRAETFPTTATTYVVDKQLPKDKQGPAFIAAMDERYEKSSRYKEESRRRMVFEDAVVQLKKRNKEIVEYIQGILVTDPKLYPEGKTDGIYSPAVERALVELEKRYQVPNNLPVHVRRIVMLQAIVVRGIYMANKGDEFELYPDDLLTSKKNQVAVTASLRENFQPCKFKLHGLRDICLTMFPDVGTMTKERVKVEKMMVSESLRGYTLLEKSFAGGKGLTTADKNGMMVYLALMKSDVDLMQKALKNKDYRTAIYSSEILNTHIISALTLLGELRGYDVSKANTDIVGRLDQMDDALNLLEIRGESIFSERTLTEADIKRVGDAVKHVNNAMAAYAVGDFKALDRELELFTTKVNKLK